MLRTWPPRPAAPNTSPVPREPARASAGAASRPRSNRSRPGTTSCRSWIRRSDDGSPVPGMEALLGGLEPGPAPRRHPRRRTAAGRRRRRHRQDPGHHAPDRLAHRHAARPPVRDPGADVHGQGRGGDGGPGRPARAVRLHGHRDRDVPRVRRRPDPRVRAGARPAHRTSASCRAPRSSSSCASTCSSSSWTRTGRSATRPGSWPRSSRCSAAARTRTSRRPTTPPTPIVSARKRPPLPRPSARCRRPR